MLKIEDFKFCVPFVLPISVIPIIIPRYSMMKFSINFSGIFPEFSRKFPGTRILGFWIINLIIEIVGMVMEVMLINSTNGTQNLKSSFFSRFIGSDVKKSPISDFFLKNANPM